MIFNWMADGKKEISPGAPEGNQNARKEEPLDAVLTIRCKKSEKNAWVNAAGGSKLAQWLRTVANKEAGIDPTERTLD